MDELDEVSRRALLIQAREALEKEYQRAEADKKSLEIQIEAKRKELQHILERVEAAKLQADMELGRITEEMILEREQIQRQNDTLKIELSQLQANRNKAETDCVQACSDFDAKIENRRATLLAVSNMVVQEEAKLRACQQSLTLIKQTLAQGDL